MQSNCFITAVICFWLNNHRPAHALHISAALNKKPFLGNAFFAVIANIIVVAIVVAAITISSTRFLAHCLRIEIKTVLESAAKILKQNSF